MIVRGKWLVIFVVAYSLFGFAQEVPEGRLMRFPDIHRDKVTFVYGGDIWLTTTAGGVARRITGHA